MRSNVYMKKKLQDIELEPSSATQESLGPSADFNKYKKWPELCWHNIELWALYLAYKLTTDTYVEIL